MPYYTRNDDDVNDFDEYDPTPYGGGYDIALTYGRPTPPSEETCYPNSSSADEIDYDRPHFSSHAKPSAYADDHLQEEYTSYSRPKPRPRPAHGGAHGGDVFLDARPEPGYGSQHERTRPDSDYGDESPRRHNHGRRGDESPRRHDHGRRGDESPRRHDHGRRGDESPRRHNHGRRGDEYERRDSDDEEG
ncbi:uncharacterized protein At5g39570 isoform X3 [Manihot esculenta]|uniref:uncharacterized protein At5g39570 isoform X3 n=1 Tax=Manihot esculenta TaxID=3983 RepID=UPI001CC8162C|nr:uncharacterized protein At5g39570 isoform X3 [Manihot esculenta]